jgi:hypothetical protein
MSITLALLLLPLTTRILPGWNIAAVDQRPTIDSSIDPTNVRLPAPSVIKWYIVPSASNPKTRPSGATTLRG